MIKNRIGIIGAGGHGKVAADIAERCGWKEVVFFDALAEQGAYRAGPWAVVGPPSCIADTVCDAFFVAIGSAGARREWLDKLRASGQIVASLVDPAAMVSRYAVMDEGVLVAPGAVVNVGASVGRGAIINTRSVVEHDCSIGAFSHVCPGATLGGGVSVGKSSWLGIGCQVKHCIAIGDNVVVGAGATVIADIESNLTVVGNPARPPGK